MAKRRLIIKGIIQGVNYRVFVKQKATMLNIKGIVRNLPDRSVEIYCRGNAKSMKRFIEAIDSKSMDQDGFEIHVEEIKVFDERTRGFNKGTEPDKYREFSIDYCRDLTSGERESLEREELTLLAGQRLSKKIGGLSGTLDKGFSELGEKVDGVGQDVRAMHDDMNKRFLEMNEKYHVISENFVRSNENLEDMNKNMAQMNENLTVTAKALVKLVEKDISERRKASKRKR